MDCGATGQRRRVVWAACLLVAALGVTALFRPWSSGTATLESPPDSGTPEHETPPVVGKQPLARTPRVIISLARQTLRLESVDPAKTDVFPVGVGRRVAQNIVGPQGTLFTGPDPTDRHYYNPRRELPAFHRGHPFLRLDAPTPGAGDQGERLWGIHGPVTPTLIWGPVSQGCFRLQPTALRKVFAVALRHPRMPVVILRGPDRVGQREVPPTAQRPDRAGCFEATIGARRLRRIAAGQLVDDRTCGGVDHWFALELASGDEVSAQLTHGGTLRLELFGIRAISAVSRGVDGLRHRVPQAHRNRGDRFVRVVATKDGRKTPYTLQVDVR